MEVAEQIVRRREIRKKKILENSDARWKKILGHEKPNGSSLDEEGATVLESSEESRLTPPDLQTKSPMPLESSLETEEQSRRSYSFGEVTLTELLKERGEEEEEKTEPHCQTTSLTPRLGESRTRSLDETANGSATWLSSAPQLQPQRSASYSFPKKVSDTESRSYSRCKLDVRDDDGPLGWLLEFLGPSGPSLVRAWLLGLVATGVRLWLALGAAWCGLQTILLPFCLFETAIYGYPKFLTRVSSSQHGPCLPSPPLSLLTAAMVLCGVPAVVASRTIACVQVLTDLAVDLAVYTFSFVVFHVIWDDWVG